MFVGRQLYVCVVTFLQVVVSTESQTTSLPLYRCYQPGDHFVSISRNCEGVKDNEGPLGCLAPNSAPGRIVQLKRCISSTGDHMSTTGSTCPTGYSLDTILGNLYSTIPVGGYALYGCIAGSDHFDSISATCEDAKASGIILGYLENTKSCTSVPAPVVPAPTPYTPSPVSPAPISSKKRYLVLGTWYRQAGLDFNNFVDAGGQAGFNSIRITADWGQMQLQPGVIDWSVLDAYSAYVIEQKNLPVIYNLWLRRNDPDEVVPLSGMALDKDGNPSPNPNGRSISLFCNASLDASAAFISAVVERYSKRYPGKILAYSTAFSAYSETE